MKKLLVASIALCALNANATMESRSKVKFKGDVEYSSFCDAVVKDDVDLLKKSVRSKIGELAHSTQSVVKLLVSKQGVKCNGSGLTEFSKKRKASEISAYLKKSK